MGRPERQLDPEAGPLQAFAFELRQLRQAAGGLSYRQLAKRAHYSVTALSEAAGGTQLPTLAVTLSYVEACGGDLEAWEARWRAVAAALSANGQAAGGVEADSPDDHAPYLGLAAFQPEDAKRFFGREQLVDELVKRLAKTPFLAVFGPSGSGKSSVLRAGLLPAVQAGRLPGSQDWPSILLTPGEHPLEELAVHLGALQGITPGSVHADLRADPDSIDLAIRQGLVSRPTDVRLLVMVDQFEEVFTLCRDEQERAQFVQALLAAAHGPRSRACVVLGVRADFYPHCADYPELVAALRDTQVLVGPMAGDELRSAIVQPAAQAGLQVEPALVATILIDALGGPGALPLVSHALLETWRRRTGRRLTLDGYLAAGGVRGAIAQTADRVYTSLDEAQQRIARSIFLRLTALGEGTEDTRRRVARAELPAGHDTEVLLDRLAAARLVTLGEDSVEVAHEALIRSWPKLRGWITEDRDAVRAHRRLTEAAAEWADSGQAEEFLYRGARLAAWQDWDGFLGQSTDLNRLERAFLAASHERQARERIAARRRVRTAFATLSGMLAVITALAVVAFVQADLAADQRDLALSRQLAASATAQLSLDPEVSLLLAREAFDVRPTAEAQAALRQATLQSRVRARLLRDQEPIRGVVFSPDGQWVASAGEDGTVWVGERTGDGTPVVLRGHLGRVEAVAFSPDGRWLASGGGDGTVRIWDWAAGGGVAPVVLSGHQGLVRTVAFSPDGQRVASASEDGTVRVWLWAGEAEPVVLGGHEGAAWGVAFSPDGQGLASAGQDGTVRVWDTSGVGGSVVLGRQEQPALAVVFSPDGQRLATAGDDGVVRVWETAGQGVPIELRGHDAAVWSVAFSPDGQRVASASDDGTVRLWRWENLGGPVVLRGHDSQVRGVAFSPDGQRVASASDDGTVRIWDSAEEGRPVVLRGHGGPVEGVAFSPDGRRVASAGRDSTVSVWDAAGESDPMILRGHPSYVWSVAFSPDGRLLASAGDDDVVRVWSTTGDGAPMALAGHEGKVFGVAFSPDGQWVATAGEDGTVRVWERAGDAPAVVLRGHEGRVRKVAFSPDGRWVASASNDGTVRVWEWARPGASPVILRGHGVMVWNAEFSPDGKWLASVGGDGTARVWQWARPDAPPVVLRGHQGHVYDVAFSPDGRLLATAGGDGMVRIWDAAGGSDPVVLPAHAGPVNGLAFSPDGQRLIGAGEDGTVRIWQCEVCGPIDQVLTLAAQRVTRELTTEERQTFLHT